MNSLLSRGLIFGAGFGCAYVLVILSLSATSGPGLLVLGGLGGAFVGAPSGFIIVVFTLGVVRLVTVRPGFEKAIAATTTGALTLLILMALASGSDTQWPWWTEVVTASAAAVIGGLAWRREKTLAEKSSELHVPQHTSQPDS